MSNPQVLMYEVMTGPCGNRQSFSVLMKTMGVDEFRLIVNNYIAQCKADGTEPYDRGFVDYIDSRTDDRIKPTYSPIEVGTSVKWNGS